MIKLKQKNAIEIITGKPWNTWNTEAVKAYFAFTDRGESREVSGDARQDLASLLYAHKTHSTIIEMWREDFKRGLLFLEDFLRSDEDYPISYIAHAFDIYEDTMGFIPKIFLEETFTVIYRVCPKCKRIIGSDLTHCPECGLVGIRERFGFYFDDEESREKIEPDGNSGN